MADRDNGLTRKPPVAVLPSQPGTYVLVLRSAASRSVQIGRWGRLEVRPGHYLYVGSAFGPGGLSARISRHCRVAKPRHWHIDHLRRVSVPISVWYSCAPQHLEHVWASAMARMRDTVTVKGFGCSDCNCVSHLCFSPEAPQPDAFARVVGRRIAVGCCEDIG